MDYSSEVTQRFDAPQRVEELPYGVPGAVSGEAGDRTLKVWVRLQLQVLDARVSRARYRVFGCPHTVAAADWLAERLEGRVVAAARSLDIDELRAALEVPVEKLGKLLKIEDALAACWKELDRARESEDDGDIVD